MILYRLVSFLGNLNNDKDNIGVEEDEENEDQDMNSSYVFKKRKSRKRSFEGDPLDVNEEKRSRFNNNIRA